MRKKYSEKWLEKELKKRVEALGGRAYKFKSPQNRGVPDRLVFMPECQVLGLLMLQRQCYPVEVKSTGETPTPIQESVHADFAELGWEVWIIDDLESLEKFIKHITDGS